jgi:hypothetical protein
MTSACRSVLEVELFYRLYDLAAGAEFMLRVVFSHGFNLPRGGGVVRQASKLAGVINERRGGHSSRPYRS